MLVYRASFRFYREELALEQFHVLMSLRAGSTLGEAIEATAGIPGASIETMMNGLSSWFEQWTKQGLFTEIKGD